MFGAGIANIAQPLIAFAICRELDASVLTTKLSVVMAALPFGFFGILFGTSYRRISDEANSIIIASTIFSHSSGVQRISYMPRAQHVPLDSNAPTEMID
jgi:malonate transporter